MERPTTLDYAKKFGFLYKKNEDGGLAVDEHGKFIIQYAEPVVVKPVVAKPVVVEPVVVAHVESVVVKPVVSHTTAFQAERPSTLGYAEKFGFCLGQ